MEIPQVPTIFNKFTNVVIGPGATIVLPRVSAKPDYEAELAFVIGRGGRYIPAARAMEHVFGYTIVNDVSARDFQNATSQWLMGKTFDTFAPMGPWIVTKDEIADPHALDISLEIGGEVLQKSNTRELIFKIPELIEYISQVVTLEPGDVVATGNSGGRGLRAQASALAAAGRRNHRADSGHRGVAQPGRGGAKGRSIRADPAGPSQARTPARPKGTTPHSTLALRNCGQIEVTPTSWRNQPT